MHRFILPALIPLFALGCAPDSTVSTDSTRIELTIEYEEAWNIDLLEVRSSARGNGRNERLPAQPMLEIEVPDSWAGQEVRFHIRGLRGTEDAIATGSGTVLPMLGTSTPLTIRLRRMSCAWCTLGEIRCFGDAIARCERNGSDDCMRWDEPFPCPTDAPFCSLGQCRTQCIDECAEGEQRCDGPEGHQHCGDFDADPCREWSTTTACSEDQSCHAGTCITGECRDQCTSGDRECRGNAIFTCGDLNDDGCSEWSPAVRCPAGESCQDGACQPLDSCTDECTANECLSTSLHECGQFDEDPCLDRSSGLSCTPIDLCLMGTCSPTMGCITSPARTCDTPPEPTCIDANTLRIYDDVGECSADQCNYVSRDFTCANCPSCDGCVGVTCNTPPAATCLDESTRRTFAPSGTCEAGDCTYTPIDTPCLRGCSAGRCVAGGQTLEASHSVGGRLFGYSVSLFGDLLAVGALFDASSSTGIGGDQDNDDAEYSGAVFVFRRSASGTWTQEAYIKASNTGENDDFGSSVSLFGDILVVGASGESSSSTGVGGDQDNDDAEGSGAVYVFRRSASGNWAQEAYLKASNTSAGDHFGTSVSFYDGLLAVGASAEDSSSTGVNRNQANDDATNSGAVYIFRRSSIGTWTQEAYIKASNTDASDFFGRSVSLSGDLLAVSAANEDSSSTGIHGDQANNDATDSGAVYVFRRSASRAWTQEAYIKASNTDANDFFGSSISLSGDLLAVGADFESSSSTGVGGDQDNDSARRSGAGYVFRRSAAGTWTQEAYLNASNTNANDRFGRSISLSGDLLAIGASERESSRGAGYVFRRSATGAWTQEATLQAPGQQFGFALSLSDDLLAVTTVGSVHIFR